MEYHPEHMRAPRNLSADQVREALEELDAKLDTLRRRARATAADSQHNYHQHIASLERKREQLQHSFTAAQQADGTAQSGSSSLWTELKTGIDTLRQDLKNLLD